MKYTPPWISLKLAEEENYHKLMGALPGSWLQIFLCEMSREVKAGCFGDSSHQSDYQLHSMSRVCPCMTFTRVVSLTGKVDSVLSFQLNRSSGKAPASKGQTNFPFYHLTKTFLWLIYFKSELKKRKFEYFGENWTILF